MQDISYIFLMGAIALIVLLCFFYSLRERKLLGRILTGVLLAAFCVIAAYIPALFCRSARLASFFYSLYFIANTWISVALFLFARIYTNRKPLPIAVQALSMIWVAADNISLLLNPWLHHEVLFQFVEKSGVSCWRFTGLPLFQLHLLLCYILLAVFFVDLLLAAVQVPRLYKKRYYVILTVLTVCVMGNGVFLLMSDILIDLSVILYGISGILVYYFTFAYLPHKLTNDMSRLVLDKVNSALLFYDLDARCVYRNELAQKWFSIDPGSDQQSLLNLLPLDTQNQEEKQITHMLQNGVEHCYRVGFQKFDDARGRYLGCFFQLEDITEERRAQQHRLYLATHDSLTGLYNQSTFCAEVRDLLDHNRVTPYSVITTNIGQFKLLNDLLGREAGDELLKTIGDTLAHVARNDVVCGRLESDKFAVCAPTQYGIEKELDQILTQKLDQMHTKYNLSIAVINYYGVYLVKNAMLPVTAMCDRANMALNAIKGNASSRVAYYDTALRNGMLRENKLIAEIPGALESGQFEVYFQPQIDSRTERIVGAEALVRWNHPESGLLAPGVFIPLLERMGLIYKLDQYVWESACRYLRELRGRGFDFPVSVNVSPRDVYSGDICQVMTELLEKYSLPVESLNLEITESAIVLDRERLIGIIQKLQSRGFRIEMDDFGSGYSSLNTLKDIPVDVVKLDMCFLKDAKDTVRSEKILRMIIGLTGALGTPVIAEGVERREQVDFLATLGCHNLQGYFYSRPVPFADFLEMLSRYEVGVLE